MKRLIKGSTDSVDKYINVTGVDGREIGLTEEEEKIYESKECIFLYKDDCILAEGIDAIKEYLNDLDLYKKC